jgi:hypothetical protein
MGILFEYTRSIVKERLQVFWNLKKNTVLQYEVTKLFCYIWSMSIWLFEVCISLTSMTPLNSFQRCQWPPWNSFGGVNVPAEILHEIFELFHNLVIS